MTRTDFSFYQRNRAETQKSTRNIFLESVEVCYSEKLDFTLELLEMEFIINRLMFLDSNLVLKVVICHFGVLRDVKKPNMTIDITHTGGKIF